MQTSPILDALFPRGRQLILSAFLLQPERRWYLSELARNLESRPSTLERELKSLTVAGALRRYIDGNRVYYQANPDFALLPELIAVFRKTMGVVPQVETLLRPFYAQIDFAFVFGSYARGEQTAASDVDLMIVGTVSQVSLARPLREMEASLRLEVNVSQYSLTELKQKWKEGNHFVRTVVVGEKIFIKGNENELANALEQSPSAIAHHEQA